MADARKLSNTAGVAGEWGRAVPVSSIALAWWRYKFVTMLKEFIKELIKVFVVTSL